MRGAVLALAALLIRVAPALASPCPDDAPRTFPAPRASVSNQGKLLLFLRPEHADAIQAIQKAHLTLQAPGSTIKTRVTPSELQSARGERILEVAPRGKLVAGKTYQLTGWPQLPPPWAPLQQASWTATAEAPGSAPPEIAVKKLGRTYCAALAADARVCALALAGRNTRPAEVLMTATLVQTADLDGKDTKPKDAKAGKNAKKPAKPLIYADIIGPGEELALHNRMCSSDMSLLPGGTYEATFGILDNAGRSAVPWKVEVPLRDVNDEMGTIPGMPRTR